MSRKRASELPEKQERLPFRPLAGSDFAAWDLYYEHCISKGPVEALELSDAGSLGLERLPALAEDLKAQGWNRIWVAGCGLSPVAPVLAHCGLEVLATDGSALAVAFQEQRDDIDSLLPTELADSELGALHCHEHDPRLPLPESGFDLVLVSDLLALFEGEDLRQVCASIFGALSAERTAVFDIGPADTSCRRRIEAALDRVGFHVPQFALRQRYLGALIETGLPHSLVMDRPVLRRTGKFSKGTDERQRAIERLQLIYEDFVSQRPEADAADAARLGPESKLAEILYAAD